MVFYNHCMWINSFFHKLSIRKIRGLAGLAVLLLPFIGVIIGQLSPATTIQAAARASAPVSLSGYFHILWADGIPGTNLTQTRFVLSFPGRADVALDLTAARSLPIDQLLRLRGQWVEVDGGWVGTQASTLQVDEIQPENGAAPLDPAVSGAQPWVTVLCKFNDVAIEPKAPAYFQTMYGSAYPFLDHYWREQSYNQINIVGSQAVGQWYTLPQPRSYYVNGSANLSTLAADCTAAADAAVNYAGFVGINLMFNSDLDGYAWGGSRTMTLDGTTKRFYMTWEPPWGYKDLTVISHEMGHGFGMPHSSFNRSSVYDNRWDVMSDTWTDCANSRDATYGCLGQHTIGYHKDLVGWLTGKTTSVAPGAQVTVTLEQLALPQTANLLLAKIPIGGTNRFYTVEVRRKVGYDVKLPGQAVILHLVDPSQYSIPAQLIDPDGDSNTGDAGAMWTVGETFTDATSGIWVRVDSATATGYGVTIANNSPTLTPTLSGSPTRTFTPSHTFTPSATRTFTATPTKTLTPTRVPTLQPGRLYHPVFVPLLHN